MITSATASNGKSVSEIQSLTLRVRDLNQTVDWWNLAMIWGLLFAALAAIFVLVATRVVVLRSKQLSAAEDQLSGAKDRQLATELREKDVKIAEAQRATAEISDRLEQERQTTARLRTEAASALANLNQRFVQAMRPRRVTMGSRGDGKTDDREERQKRFKVLEQYAGTMALIQSVPEQEPKILAGDIWAALHERGWNPVIVDESQSHISPGLIRPGVRIATLEKPWGFKPNKGDRPIESVAPDFSPSWHAAMALLSLLSLDLGPPYEMAPFSLSYEPEYKKWDAQSPYPGEKVPEFPAILIEHGFHFPEGAVVILVGMKPTEYPQINLPDLIGPPVP